MGTAQELNVGDCFSPVWQVFETNLPVDACQLDGEHFYSTGLFRPYNADEFIIDSWHVSAARDFEPMTVSLRKVIAAATAEVAQVMLHRILLVRGQDPSGPIARGKFELTESFKPGESAQVVLSGALVLSTDRVRVHLHGYRKVS